MSAERKKAYRKIARYYDEAMQSLDYAYNEGNGAEPEWHTAYDLIRSLHMKYRELRDSEIR
jgi:hypothetical protein